jgi:hypothetical protein
MPVPLAVLKTRREKPRYGLIREGRNFDKIKRKILNHQDRHRILMSTSLLDKIERKFSKKKFDILRELVAKDPKFTEAVKHLQEIIIQRFEKETNEYRKTNMLAKLLHLRELELISGNPAIESSDVILGMKDLFEKIRFSEEASILAEGIKGNPNLQLDETRQEVAEAYLKIGFGLAFSSFRSLSSERGKNSFESGTMYLWGAKNRLVGKPKGKLANEIYRIFRSV